MQRLNAALGSMELPASESLGAGGGWCCHNQGMTLASQAPPPHSAHLRPTAQQRRAEATTNTISPEPPNNTTSYHPAMAEEKQPPGLVEGATGEVEEEVQDKAKSAEDRKAAAALSKLDARDDDVAGASVDQEGLNKAMNKLSVSKTTENKDLKKVKVDAADVTLLVSLAHGRSPPWRQGTDMAFLHRLTSSTLLSPRLPSCSSNTREMRSRP